MAVILLSLLVAQCFGYIKEKSLFVLSDNDYDTFLEAFKDDLRVILFFYPSFGSSSGTSGDFFQISNDLASTKIRMAKVDMSNSKSGKLKERFAFNTYPHILYCLAQTDICRDYKEPKTRKALTTSFKAKMYQYQSFYDLEDFDQYLVNNSTFDGIVLGIFSKFSGEKYETFVEFAKRNMDNYQFGLIRDEGEWTYRFNLTSDSIVLVKGKFLHTSVYPNFHVLSLYKDIEDIEKFMERNFHPYLSYVNPISFQSLYNESIPFGMFYIDFKKHYNLIPYLAERFAYFSEKYITADWEQRKFQWAIADTNDFTSNLTKLGLQNEEMLMLIEFRRDLYKIGFESILEDGKFKEDCLYNFYRNYDFQRYPIYRYSQPVPKLKYEKGVRVAVGSNIEQLLDHKDHIQALMIYDSSSPELYQAKLAIFEEVARHYKNNFKIEFVKIDANLNYVPESYAITMNQPRIIFAGDSKQGSGFYDSAWESSKIIEKIESLIHLKVDL